MNGAALQPRLWWAGNCSADPPRGSIGPTRTRPENLGNRAAANYRFLNGSAASAVCPDRSREIRHPAVRRKRKARHALRLSLSQTHCRAALLSVKSRAMTESGAARPGDSQGRNLLQKHLGEILASQTPHLSIEKPCSMGRPSRRPTAIQAALRRRRAGDAWLGRCSKVWMRSNWMRWSIRRGTARLTDRRPQFAARQVGRRATKP